MKKRFSFRLLFLSFIILMVNLGCGSSAKLLDEGSPFLNSLNSNPNLSTFTSLLKTPGLGSMVNRVIKEPFTLLAPTNDAFNALPPGTLDSLKNPANVPMVANLVKDNVISGKKLSPAEIQAGGLTTADGRPLNLSGANLGSAMVEDKFNIIPIDKVLH